MTKKLTKKEYKQIAKEEGLSPFDANIYSDFMRKRFPNESYKEYAREWAKRFKTINPKIFMDRISLRIYNQILKNKLEK